MKTYIPTPKQAEELHRKYASSDKHFELCFRHSQIVAEIALWCVDNMELRVDRKILEAGCLLHDIGAYMLMDEDANITSYYNLHAIFGSKILKEEDVDQAVCDAVETHINLGMTAEDHRKSGWAYPHKDYIPSTLESQLVTYADRFHSKVPIFNKYETTLKSMKNEFPKNAELLVEYRQKFGLPDLEELAKKYGHPIQ